MADPAASGLQLAGNQWLTVPMIVRELALRRCRLVTLSACEPAMLDVQQLPDEFVGLPAAFLQAGTPGVVATFWSVLDGPTAAMIARFYQLHLAGEGMTPAAALRRAVVDLRDLGEAAAAELQATQVLRQAVPSEATDGDDDPNGCDATPGDVPPELPPEMRRLFALPLIWAAYAHRNMSTTLIQPGLEFKL